MSACECCAFVPSVKRMFNGRQLSAEKGKDKNSMYTTTFRDFNKVLSIINDTIKLSDPT